MSEEKLKRMNFDEKINEATDSMFLGEGANLLSDESYLLEFGLDNYKVRTAREVYQLNEVAWSVSFIRFATGRRMATMALVMRPIGFFRRLTVALSFLITGRSSINYLFATPEEVEKLEKFSRNYCCDWDDMNTESMQRVDDE